MQDMQPSRPRNFCDSCAIRNRAICAELDEREIDLLNTIGRRRTLAAGEQLMWEGDHFAREHPRLEHKLLERTLGELDRTRRWMLLLGRMNAEQKVASFLIEMADRLGNGVAGAQTSLILPVSRQQIADVLGLTIETVSRQLTRLRSAGAIELPSRREIILRDRADLELRAG